MNFDKWFDGQSRLIQVILLLIPLVNWITEILVRVSSVLNKKGDDQTKAIIGCVLAIIIPVWGWVDLICVILTNKLCFE